MKSYILESLADLNKLLASLKPANLIDLKFSAQIVGSDVDGSGVTRYRVVDRFLAIVDESKKK